MPKFLYYSSDLYFLCLDIPNLVADLTKRYGNLRGGVNDIKEHRLFGDVNWEDMLKKKVIPIYKPTIS